MGTLEQISICKNEDRNSLDNLKNKLNKFANWYFTPKSFEKSGKLYEWGGAKLFGKYWINGGSKYSTSGSFLSGETLGKKLNNAYNLTKACELLHLGGFILLALIDFKDYLDGNVVDMASNYLINILPIMSQRYVRNKIIPLRNRLKEREKLIFSSPQESLKEQ